jgi:hypothetical protein
VHAPAGTGISQPPFASRDGRPFPGRHPGKFPACRFDALQNFRQARSAYGSFALSG